MTAIMSSSTTPEFKLKGSTSTFSSKLDSVFAGLGQLEKEHNDWNESEAKQSLPSVQKEDPVTLQDSEFAIPRSRVTLDRRNLNRPDYNSKKPEFKFRVPNRRPPRAPDHKTHPERWTKYSLDSVSEKDMSDRANTAAAFAFLKQQERRAQGEADEEEDHRFDLREKIVFNRRKSSQRPSWSERKSSDSPPRKVMAVGASAAPKLVMPTVEIGASKSTKKKHSVPGPRQGAADKITLTHLGSYDDEEVEDNDDGEMEFEIRPQRGVKKFKSSDSSNE